MVKFIDLQHQYQRISQDLEKRMLELSHHGQYVLGPEIDELESKLGAFVGVKHAVSVSSGTDALLLALMSIGIEPGDEVITTPFSFISTGEVIMLLGATPVFVDINADTYNMNPQLIEKAITSRTKAILPVSLYGQCVDFDPINEIAEKHGLSVIEDGAQSFGARYKGKFSCGLTSIACTSFFPSKPLGAYGDAGACFTNDDEHAVKLKQLRNHGQDSRYHHSHIGINGRMDSMQAAVLLSKLAIYPEEIALREKVAKYYSEHLSEFVKTPYIESHNQSVFAQYTIATEVRDQLQQKLKEKGIPTTIHYPYPIYMQPAFTSLGIKAGICPVAELAAKCVLSLPMHPYMQKEEQAYIVEQIAQAAQ